MLFHLLCFFLGGFSYTFYFYMLFKDIPGKKDIKYFFIAGFFFNFVDFLIIDIFLDLKDYFKLFKK